MPNHKRLTAPLAITLAIGCLSIVAVTRAQDGPRPGGAAVMAASGTATVKAIDPASRTVTLEKPDGQTAVVRCGAGVRNFDQIAVGDQVRATLLGRMVVGVVKPGTAPTGQRVVIARAAHGAKPGLIISETVQLSERIDAVDAQARSVTLRDEDGKPQAYTVAPDVDLSGVKVGDDVVVQVTRGLALVVEKPEGEPRLTGVKIAPGEAAAAEMMTATATVESIDEAKRLVTLKNPQGETHTVYLGEGCINFDQIKVGDRVTATLAEEHAIAVGKPGSLPREADEDAKMVRAPAGSKPRVLLTDAEQLTARVDAIDAANRTVTLTPMGGTPRTIHVGPAVDLEALKPGDEVAVRCTQALAIVVESP